MVTRSGISGNPISEPTKHRVSKQTDSSHSDVGSVDDVGILNHLNDLDQEIDEILTTTKGHTAHIAALDGRIDEVDGQISRLAPPFSIIHMSNAVAAIRNFCTAHIGPDEARDMMASDLDMTDLYQGSPARSRRDASRCSDNSTNFVGFRPHASKRAHRRKPSHHYRRFETPRTRTLSIVLYYARLWSALALQEFHAILVKRARSSHMSSTPQIVPDKLLQYAFKIYSDGFSPHSLCSGYFRAALRWRSTSVLGLDGPG
ncbi:hypothetical protein C8J57DRAFT_1239669 [Mycena rebaudengoi]|nr:hypothetical protein C8J57DRAFT_1239669 [Mycena rebaudengoi]